MTCQLCNHEVRLIQSGFPGYQAGQAFDIFECPNCNVSIAMPIITDDHLYELIYQNIAHIPGYCRYLKYFNRVSQESFPLDYLCAQEESYWAVGSYLREKRTKEGSFSVLEIGSGMGYFTYALAVDGFQIKGIDISDEAVSAASAKFGNLFICSDLESHAKQAQHLYDVIVMNQLIEHVTDLNCLLQTALQLLAPRGTLLITTPNKGVYKGSTWGTELPPVHHWWLSEDTLSNLALRFGLQLDFVDFSQFYREQYRSYDFATPVPAPQSFLAADGSLLVSVKVSELRERFRDFTDKYHLKPVYRRIRDALMGKSRWLGSKGPDICAILQRN
ncbi:MAG: class I SAM-dependent methyltransferase [Desulfobacteraceae bacterium]|nr:class I SAM-dependent methyltransferase [Desulfobacteraceae bacterium]